METQEPRPQNAVESPQEPPAAVTPVAEPATPGKAGSSLKHKKAALATLCKFFPKTFLVKGEIRPLKVGIINDLLTSPIFEQLGWSRNMVRRAVRFYATSPQYLKCVKEGAMRIDLDGNDADMVTATHEEYAQKLIKTLAAKREEAEKRQRAQAALAGTPKSSRSSTGVPKGKKLRRNNKKQLSPEAKKTALEASAAKATAAAAAAAAEAARKKAEQVLYEKQLAKLYVGRPVTFKNPQGKVIKGRISKKPANGKVGVKTTSGNSLTIPVEVLLKTSNSNNHEN